jgi:hypothetical protein
MRLTLLAFVLAAAAPASAQTADEAAALRSATERGRLLYAYDQAAWHGTDDMLRKIKKPQDQLGGWIVDGPPEAAQLVFYDKDAADPHAVYIATFRGSKLTSSRVLRGADDRSLTPQRTRMIAAARAASAAFSAGQVPRCADRPFNTVTLPPANPNDPVSVYFLTPQTELGTIPFGGHYRIDVSADGQAGPLRAFTKSCIALPVDPPANDKGQKPIGMVVSHLLDPTPTEIHVFSSLAARKPVYVVTGSKKLWAVDGDRSIRPVDTGAK